MEYKCYFCNSTDLKDVRMAYREIPNSYECPKCGFINLASDAADDIPGERFTDKEKQIISIFFRNQYERQNKKQLSRRITLSDLRQTISQYSPLEPLEKMDNALLNIERTLPYVGAVIRNFSYNDYPYYHCYSAAELRSILLLLQQQGLINAPDPANPHVNLSISAKGYGRLSEIKKHAKDSRQCFVAMWFTPEMNAVYESAIKPAIEYVEEGEIEPRFRAIKIDNVEHLNDINDEIISAIRRSRFMVCDLSGYRGGVYFEAGFARGLGLDVIYTCRKDWLKSEFLQNKEGDRIEVLYNAGGKEIKINKEGIHFDIEHINRIEWEEDKPDDFKKRLLTRIKANIL
jgi:hypothetical protein